MSKAIYLLTFMMLLCCSSINSIVTQNIKKKIIDQINILETKKMVCGVRKC